MTDDSIEAKALALAIEARDDDKMRICPDPTLTFSNWEALCRAIERHEAFKQEVSDAVVEYFGPKHLDVILAGHRLNRFIIPKPKPDPLVEAYLGVFPDNQFTQKHVARIRAALDALGFEIREKGQ